MKPRTERARPTQALRFDVRRKEGKTGPGFTTLLHKLNVPPISTTFRRGARSLSRSLQIAISVDEDEFCRRCTLRKLRLCSSIIGGANFNELDIVN